GGQDGVNRAELAALDLPLSIVIDPLSEGAAERAAIWRAGGQEVVMAGTGIPAGAGPGDLEQSFQVLASRLPESVAVIDPDGRAFQNNRPLAAQVVPILAEQGRGLVTFDQGLNAADQVARREGLAAATIFRSIDGGNEDSPVIRRYLDRAAFKAAQEGRVIVIGTLRPETVAGILEWAVEGRASTVALAPVSAMLRN
ncbi:MAG: divergent polysaccharide deacetylase family protein, partial [Pseudorhodobacter sp.]|nr:divergent polysaccharide deacetylase family protein [Pseudorhodobacter sp.]